jgi:hypothetical protein
MLTIRGNLLAAGYHSSTYSIEAYSNVLMNRMHSIFMGFPGVFATFFRGCLVCLGPFVTRFCLVFAVAWLLDSLFNFLAQTLFWCLGIDQPDNTVDEAFMEEMRDAMNYESRDDKGAQKSNKSKTLRMEFEAAKRPLFVFKSLDYFGKKIEFIQLNPDITRDIRACTDVSEREDLREELALALRIHAKVATAAIHRTKSDLDATKLIASFMRQCEKDGIEQHEILSAVGREKEAFLCQDPNTSPKVKQMLYESTIETLKTSDLLGQEFQGSADQNCDGVSAKILKNLCSIKPAGSATRTAHMFFYRGRAAWMNKHVFLQLTETSQFTITRHSDKAMPQDYTFNWCDCKVQQHENLDLVLVQFPRTLSPFPEVFDLIAKDADMNFAVLPGGRLVTRRGENALYLNTAHPIKVRQAFKLPCGSMQPFDTAIASQNMHTHDGDCGSPFLAIDAQAPRKIMGMHMMGNGVGSATATIITQELLQDMEKHSKFDQHVEVPAQDFQGVAEPFVQNPLFKTPTPFEPTKTKVRRSLIHGMVTEPITRPTILRPTEECDPMVRGVRELQSQKHIVSEKFLERASGVLTRFISGKPVIARTLTLEEACTGKGVPGLEPVERSTSAGLPLSLEPNAQGKKKWIDEDHQPTPALCRMVATFIREVEIGKVENPPIFKDTLKDERVKLAKADMNHPENIKTRLFAASPLVFLLTLRMFFGAFFGHAIFNAIFNTCTSGANPFGSDWHQLADWLHQVSKKVDDGDYKCYDTTQPSGFLIAVFDSIRAWYRLNGGSERDDMIRERLAEFCYHAFHSCRGTVYRVQGTLPSGMFGTTQINSGVNLVTFFYAFTKIYPNATNQEFLDNVRTATHGDDVIFAVSDKFPEFTSENIGLALAEIGMVFTPALKGDTPTVARPIEEVTFLKRSFKKIQGLYRAPLATESSLEMCNWITKSNDPRTATIDNCKNAMRELALSEPNDDWQKKIQAAVYNQCGELLPIISASELCAEFKKFY